jgi:predicted lactoylglutathione lyase
VVKYNFNESNDIIMSPRMISIITLGVRDLAKSSKFYQELGFNISSHSDENIVWFITEGTVLGLYPWEAMADDAGISPKGSGFRGITLAINLKGENEVNAFIDHAQHLGAKVIKNPQKVFWGGYSSYFQDFDGHLWEVAYNPFTPVSEDGKLDIES